MKKIFYFFFSLTWFSLQAQYSSLLWEISGNGLKKPSYLFGTMHSASSAVQKVSDRALPFFNSCDGYAMEIDPKQALDISLLSQLMMGDGYSLKEMLPAADYRLIDSIVQQQTGFGLTLLDNVAPVFVMSVLEMAETGVGAAQSNEADILDLHFYQLAKDQHKKTSGVETVEEQLNALQSLSYQEQADMLTRELNELRSGKTNSEELLRYYAEEKLDSLSSANDRDSMPEKFYKALVTDRNYRMAGRIASLVQKRATFIAIGALHLPGEAGVIELLRKKGFRVDAVKRN